MDKKSDSSKLIKDGLIKSVLENSKVDLNSADKMRLNRKGNQLYNEKKFEEAKKIFLATGYSDGLSRIGDYYKENSDIVNALKFYVLAKRKDKYEKLVDTSATVIKNFINDKEE